MFWVHYVDTVLYVSVFLSLWLFDEQGLYKMNGCSVQVLQLFLSVTDVDLWYIEEGLLLIIPQKRRDARQHHIREDTNTPIREMRRSCTDTLSFINLSAWLFLY